MPVARVFYPETESYTTEAILKAFQTVLPDWTLLTENNGEDERAVDLQICDYDLIDWDIAERSNSYVNAYMLRKALIRKSYLATTISHHVSKNPNSLLASSTSFCIPQTYPFEITHADELDELFYDELYEVGQALENGEASTSADGTCKWWTLKPAMADKGQGIRLFRTRGDLEAILEEFEDSSDEEDEEDEKDDENRAEDAETGDTRHDATAAPIDTKVRLSQMREWVIQEYISDPLLIDPIASPGVYPGVGRKFHLRVYVLAVGALQVYVYTDMLALFAPAAYALPKGNDDAESDEDSAVIDLTSHLTNTCLQDDEQSASSVFTLSSLIGKPIISARRAANTAEADSVDVEERVINQEDIQWIVERIGNVTAETFSAALGMRQHFSAAPNSFEVFGLDFLLSYSSAGSTASADPDGSGASGIEVHLLEVNACPDFKQSGSEGRGVIEGLWKGVLEIAVKPNFGMEGQAKWEVGHERSGFRKCLDVTVKDPARSW